ncbi:hypothetical protein PR048_010815 [Dryococelus australis]|uniref:DUF4371 domain-containing protein n=1 Tax=Dryococelus australis TaxID=614101 RepID=A0ABQ9I3S3_9NEOP|nr:hypothetical protein PR048_010815 [Dryococelus australis]
MQKQKLDTNINETPDTTPKQCKRNTHYETIPIPPLSPIFTLTVHLTTTPNKTSRRVTRLGSVQEQESGTHTASPHQRENHQTALEARPETSMRVSTPRVANPKAGSSLSQETTSKGNFGKVDNDADVCYDSEYRNPILKPWISSSKSKEHTAYGKFCKISSNDSKSLMIRHANTPKIQAEYWEGGKGPYIVSLFKSSSTYQMVKQIKETEVRLCAYVAEHNLPSMIMDTPPLMRTVAPDSVIVKKIQCGHSKRNYFIKNDLAVVSLDEFSRKLQNNYFSLIIDESTDITANKSLAVVLPLANLLGFADNVSVMTGHNSGIQAPLKSLNEHFFVGRCICHSFNLCAAEACKKLRNALEELSADIYIIKIKPKRLVEFKQIEELLNLIHTIC